MSTKYAYYCIGGPLDGEFATTDDMSYTGLYEKIYREYIPFNGANSGFSMIFVHNSIYKKKINAKNR